MSSVETNSVKREMKKWVWLSQRYEISSIICEAKIKSHLAIFEKSATLEEINQIQSDLGNILFSIQSIMINYFRQ